MTSRFALHNQSAPPSAWSRLPTKRLFRVVNGSTPKSSEAEFWDGEILWATPDDLGSLRSVEISETRRAISQSGYESCGTTLVPGGSIVMSTRAPIGHLAIASRPLCVNQGCRCLVPIRPSVDSRFFYYQFFAGRQQLESLGQGSTFRELGKSELEMFLVFVPSPNEQRAIAGFLDRETAKIDALVAKKERLIALLQEKRTALISHAVTKGLNPDVKMKDSGVEWLGEVPEHWEIIRTRYLCKMTTGGRDTQDAEEQGEYPFFVRSDTIERISSWSFDGEGVLTSGDGVGVGKVFHHYIGKLEFHQRVYLFHDFRDVTGRYFYHFLKANLYKVVLEGTAKSTVDSLRRPMLQSFPVAVPPLVEQVEIVESVDRESRTIDALIS